MKKIGKIFTQLLSVYCREFKLVMHDQGLIIFFLFLPIAYPVIYSLIYNKELVRDVSMVVVDNDRSHASRDLVRKLDATQAIWVKGYAADMPEARHAMNSHECYAILEIPEGYARSIGRTEQAHATIFVESSLLLRYRAILMSVAKVSTELSSEILTERINRIAPLAGTITDGDLLPIENVSLGNIEGGFATFIMGGVLMVILQQSIILAVGMAGGAKRERPGVTGYNAVDAVPSVALTMLGQMCCYATILAVPILFMIHYVPLFFQFPLVTQGVDVLAFLLPFVLASFGVGFCVQALIWERESIFVLWVATSVIFLFITGLTWPRFNMGGFWLWLSDAVPATWAVNGFLRMHTDGASLAQVHDCYINLWICAAVYLALGYCVQRWLVRPTLANGAFAYDRVRARQI